MYTPIFLCVFLGVLLHQAWAYPEGAGSEACGDMIPIHNYTASTAPSPFVVELSKDSYKAKEQISVTIKNKPGVTSYFEGFLLQARLSGKTNPIGSFKAEPSETHQLCKGDSGSGLTHSNDKERYEYTALWTAPDTYQGPVTFYATVVHETDEFWVKVASQEINDQVSSGMKLYTSTCLLMACLCSFYYSV